VHTTRSKCYCNPILYPPSYPI